MGNAHGALDGDPDAGVPDAATGVDDDAGTDAGDGTGTCDAGAAGDPAPTVTPSNLPSNICDVPGTQDLVVTASSEPDFYTTPCDSVISQSDGLPSICVRKFANVTVGGPLWGVSPGNEQVVAIVATGTFTVEESGTIVVADGPADPRGLPPGYNAGGGGAGHIGAGGAGSSPGGSAYGPTTGNQLVPGADGHFGDGGYSGGTPGFHGAALQVVACHDLHLLGSIEADGSNGQPGHDDYTPHVEYPGSGGGGGSGGTLVIEAARILGSGGQLSAVGGQGGRAGGAPGDYTVPGGAGAPGRIVVNVPACSASSAFTSDPPATIGIVGTH